MFERGSGRLAVVLEQSHVFDARVGGGRLKTVEVSLNEDFHFSVGKLRRSLAVIGRLDDHFVNPHARDLPPDSLNGALPLSLACQAGKLARRHPHAPAGGIPYDVSLGPRDLLVPRTEGASRAESWQASIIALL